MSKAQDDRFREAFSCAAEAFRAAADSCALGERTPAKPTSVDVSWPDVRNILNHRYSPGEDDAEIIDCLMCSGSAPPWLQEANVWVDCDGWHAQASTP